MRNIAKTLLAFALCLPMIACKSTEQSSTSGATSNETESPTTIVTSDPVVSDDIEWFGTFKDVNNPVAFDYPECRTIEEGYSEVFSFDGYYIVYCVEQKQAELDGIISELSEQFAKNTTSHLTGTFDSFLVNSSEETTINGTDALELDGEVLSHYDDGTQINSVMHSYTFAKSDAICGLIGYVDMSDTYADSREENEVTIVIIMSVLAIFLIVAVTILIAHAKYLFGYSGETRETDAVIKMYHRTWKLDPDTGADYTASAPIIEFYNEFTGKTMECDMLNSRIQDPYTAETPKQKQMAVNVGEKVRIQYTSKRARLIDERFVDDADKLYDAKKYVFPVVVLIIAELILLVLLCVNIVDWESYNAIMEMYK